MATGVSRPSEAAVTVWARLLRAQRTGLALVERRLKQAGLPSLEWYDALLELERGGPMRPRDLEPKLLLAQYNLSRLLQRMVQAGLIARSMCPADGRGVTVSITKAGRRMREAMWPAYAAGIQAAIGDKLSTAEIESLLRLLAPLSAPDLQPPGAVSAP